MDALRVPSTLLVLISSLGWLACAPGGFSKKSTQTPLTQAPGIDSTHEVLDSDWETDFPPFQIPDTNPHWKAPRKVKKFEPILDPHPETADDEDKKEIPQAAEEPPRESRPETPPEPAPQNPPKNSLKGPPSGQIIRSGVITPTVYYFPIIDESKVSCKDKVSLFNKKGISLIRICQSTLAACALQGSCAIVQGDKLRSFNVAGRTQGQNRFFEMTDDPCKYGYGVKNSCLDPFYTVAADLTIYKPGDVIYVPAVAGLHLPNGSEHHGYFVVRDTGGAIKGKGRFDFFSGFYSWRDQKNPFVKLGLASKKTRLPYYQVSGKKVGMVLQSRRFPSLPPQSIGLNK